MNYFENAGFNKEQCEKLEEMHQATGIDRILMINIVRCYKHESTENKGTTELARVSMGRGHSKPNNSRICRASRKYTKNSKGTRYINC